MRYTPFLDAMGITFKDDVDVDSLINIIDTCLASISNRTDWGSFEGKRRKPCPEQPLLLAGQPIGQYHCPVCGDMQVAAVPHLAPSDDYEAEHMQPWPAGYLP